MDQPKLPDKRKNQLNSIAKYSGFGIEMAAGILIPILVGQKLDARMGNSKLPIFTLLFAALGLAYVFYKLFKFSSK